MNDFSSIRFSIAESGYERGRHGWPAAMSFPHFPGGKVFSVENQLPMPHVVMLIDLSQLMELMEMKGRVVH